MVLTCVLLTGPTTAPSTSDAEQVRHAASVLSVALYEGDEAGAAPLLSISTEQQSNLFKEMMATSRNRLALNKTVFRTFTKQDTEEWWVDREPAEELRRFQEKIDSAIVSVTGATASVLLEEGKPLYVFHRDETGWRLDVNQFLSTPGIITDSDRDYSRACVELIPRVEKGEFKSAKEVRDALTKRADQIAAMRTEPTSQPSKKQ